jgi:F-type H+-transporting ATPase subunit b
VAIDWITVSAQIVNFLILVWLLKQFLYQPVIRAMEHRKQTVAEQLDEARAREKKAAVQIQQHQDMSAKLEKDRDAILATAEKEAAAQKKIFIEAARLEAIKKRDSWQHQANEEKQEFIRNLRHRAAETIQAIAGKALRDLASADLEKQVVNTFIERLNALDQKAWKSLKDSSEPLVIASAFKLDSSLRAQLTRVIHEHLASSMQVDYIESAELVLGIELTRGGQRLSWNLSNYLDELNSSIEEAITSIGPVRETE